MDPSKTERFLLIALFQESQIQLPTAKSRENLYSFIIFLFPIRTLERAKELKYKGEHNNK